MVVRAAREADLPTIRALEAVTQTAAHWSSREYGALFSPEAPLRIALVAIDENEPEQIAGFLIARCLPGEWEIENIAITPFFRRAGHATKLVQSLIERARSQNAAKILLEVRESNLAARRLYEKIGFMLVGRRPAYYRDPQDDALLLHLPLQERDISP